MFKDFFLELAYGLSVLTYFLGVLMFSLPLPIRSIKKWGSLLVQDGLFSALLVLLFNFILSVIDYIRGLLGVDIDKYFNYMYMLEDRFMSFMLLVKIVSKALGLAGLSALSSVISPFAGVLTIAISSIALVIIISSIVIKKAGFFIALGIMLYALPFRIGRSAGASLIAFTVIGSIAFPLLPSWIGLFIDPSNYPDVNVPKGVVFLSGRVEGDIGYPKTAVLGFIDPQSGDKYVFIVKDKGVYNAGKPDKGLPANMTLTVLVLFLGEKLLAVPEKVTVPKDLRVNHEDPSADYRLDIRVNGIFILDSILVKVRGCSEFKVEERGKSFTVICRGISGPSFVIEKRFQRACEPVPVEAVNVTRIDIKISNYTWYGIKASMSKDVISVNSTNAVVKYSIVNGKCETEYPNIRETRYARNLVSSATDIIISSFWLWISITVAVLSYLTIISMLSYGLASALGAWRSRIPMPFI